MCVREQERGARQAALRAEEGLGAFSGPMSKAERKAREATHRTEELKWRIDGRGIRPRSLPGCWSTEVSEGKGEA